MQRINHLIVLMMENRSFDHVLGHLTLGGRTDVAGITAPRSNPDGRGGEVAQSCLDGQPHKYNVPHGLRDVMEQWDQGKLDGFVTAYLAQNPNGDPRVPMGYYTGKTFSVLSALADRFTVCDHWFSSVLSSTWPNRKYFHSGTRDDDDDTQLLPAFPGFRTKPIYEAIENTMHPSGLRRLTWKNYFCDMPFLAFWYGFAFTHISHFESVMRFAEDCAAGTLPDVAIIDPPFTLADDHPPHDPALGEKFIGLIVDALSTSKSWDDTALLIVFDEHGGFYDHVAPPAPPTLNKHKDTPYGFRVPALLVSPYTADRRCVQTVFDHTSFMKSIAERWGVDFPTETYDVRWQAARSFWEAFNADAKPLPRGIYTGVSRTSDIAALNWTTGVYERLGDDVHRFEQFLDRIFVLPELKALDHRAAVYETLGSLEHQVITQKRMYEAGQVTAR